MLIAEITTSSDTSDMTRRVQLCRQALDLCLPTEDPALLAFLHAELANSLLADATRGKADTSEEIIHHYQQALRGWDRETDKRQWGIAQNNLANAYLTRRKGHRTDNIDAAIHHIEQALSTYTNETGAEHWATARYNLGLAHLYRTRGRWTKNIEIATQLFRQALSAYSQETSPQQWSTVQSNLALAYLQNCRHTQEDNIAAAIHHYTQALDTWTQEQTPHDWALTQHNLGLAYRHSTHGNPAKNIEIAIRHYTEALHVWTQAATPWQWAKTQQNLADVFLYRTRHNRGDNIETAIHHHTRALSVWTKSQTPHNWGISQHGLALAYWHRFRGEKTENMEIALDFCRQALTVWSPEQSPFRCYTVGKLMGEIGCTAEQWETAISGYTQASRAEKIFWYASAAGSALLTSIASPPTCDDVSSPTPTEHTPPEIARRRLAFRHDATSGRISAFIESQPKAQALQEFLLLLEEERKQKLDDALEKNARCLHSLHKQHPGVFFSYRETAINIQDMVLYERQMPNVLSPANNTDQAAQTEQEINFSRKEQARTAITSMRSILTRIRKISGYEDFFGPLPPDLLDNAVSPRRPVAFITLTSHGSILLLAHRPSSSDPVEVSHVETSHNLTKGILRNALRIGGGNTQEAEMPPKSKAFSLALDACLSLVSKAILVPLVERLQQLHAKKVVLIPSGQLAMLPLHAAPLQNITSQGENTRSGTSQRLLHSIEVSYAPSLSHLSAARQQATHVSAKNCVLTGAGNPISGLLSISDSELTLIAKHANTDSADFLFGGKVTKAAIHRTARNATHVHLSCNAHIHLENPLESGFALAENDTLSLRDILENRPFAQTRLVVASASFFLTQKAYQIDKEPTVLPTSLIESGTGGAVTALWPVDDVSTPLLFDRFYRLHLQNNQKIPGQHAKLAREKSAYTQEKNKQNTISIPKHMATASPRLTPLHPANALRQAQIWLANITAQELALLFTEADQVEKNTDNISWRPRGTAAYQATRFHRRHPDERPFAALRYWAPFTYWGT